MVSRREVITHNSAAPGPRKRPGAAAYLAPTGARATIGGEVMANGKQTGPRAASAAGRALGNPRATKTERSAAASALAQTRSTDQTGPRAASAAGATLANPKATKTERSVAASALAQTPARK